MDRLKSAVDFTRWSGLSRRNRRGLCRLLIIWPRPVSRRFYYGYSDGRQKRIAGLNRVEEQKEGARFNWYVNRVSLAFAVRTGERAYKGRAGRLSFMRARTRWLYHTLSPRWYRPKSSGFRVIDFRMESVARAWAVDQTIESDFNPFRSILRLLLPRVFVPFRPAWWPNTMTYNGVRNFWWFFFWGDFIERLLVCWAIAFISWKQCVLRLFVPGLVNLLGDWFKV